MVWCVDTAVPLGHSLAPDNLYVYRAMVISDSTERTLLSGDAGEAVHDALVGRDLAALDARVGVLHMYQISGSQMCEACSCTQHTMCCTAQAPGLIGHSQLHFRPSA